MTYSKPDFTYPKCIQPGCNWNGTHCAELLDDLYGEDCLYLQIAVPEHAFEEPELYPVFFYIHGGGFSTGSGHEFRFDASYTAAQMNAVVVTVNYRLNVFGFLGIPWLYEGENAIGNIGLVDQETGLRFVHDYIKYFKGDPNRVTLSGNSAGAESTWTHLQREGDVQNYFSKAITISNPISVIYLDPERVQPMVDVVYKTTNCSDISCLKNVSKHLLSHAGSLAWRFDLENRKEQGAQLSGFLQHMTPIIDNVVVKKQMFESAVIKKPIIFGTCADEGQLFVDFIPFEVTQKVYEASVKVIFKSFDQSMIENRRKVDKILSRYPYTYDCDRFHPDFTDNSVCNPEDAMSAVITDYMFFCSMRQVAQKLREENENVWVYSFAEKPLFQIAAL